MLKRKNSRTIPFEKPHPFYGKSIRKEKERANKKIGLSAKREREGTEGKECLPNPEPIYLLIFLWNKKLVCCPQI
jgi:hypothetical protein